MTWELKTDSAWQVLFNCNTDDLTWITDTHMVEDQFLQFVHYSLHKDLGTRMCTASAHAQTCAIEKYM